MGCGQEWKPADPRQVYFCPACESPEFERINCVDSEDKPGGCYLITLNQSITDSQEASIFEEIREIENAIALKLVVTINDVRADVYPALIILHEERERYHKENPNG